MQKAVLVAFVAACAVAFPVKRDTHVHDGDEENEMMGLAWHAAAGEINEGRHGKYLVPTKLVSHSTNGNIITIEAIYQESWCSTEEGHNLEDVCEEMCPIYQGSPEKKYRLTIVTSSDGEEEITVENL